MKSWRQPICRPCFAAYSLGRGDVATREPVAVREIAESPCLICRPPTRIYVRVDPALTAGLAYAVEEG